MGRDRIEGADVGNFETAMAITEGHEGGWANNPADRGGETFRGISRRFHPEWKGWEKIDSAKIIPGNPGGPNVNSHFPANINNDADLQELSEEFYRGNFWDIIHGDELPLPLACAVFDMGVNFGPSRAIRQMQAVLGVTVDCVPGPQTVKAAHDKGFSAVLSFIAARMVAHHRDAVSHPDQEQFIPAWFTRCVALAAQVACL